MNFLMFGGNTLDVESVPVTVVRPVADVDAVIDTHAEMAEIRKALRAQQEIEDRVADPSLDPKNTSVHTAGTEQSSPGFGYWDFDAEKKEGDEEDGQPTDTVFYNDGATELFKCIEEGLWDRASKLLQSHSEQASIWVISTGTVDTTFNWSKWKRLPLHEAARRQPPTIFMTQLITAYPAAVKAVTQFGELPLHLAVECGASPGVVNLLAVSHWRGCHTTDQSGRTPLDVLQENDMLLDPIEHDAVVAALQSSAAAYQEIVSEHSHELASMQDEHAMGLQAVRQQHDEDLQEEQEKQEILLEEIASLQQELSLAQSVSAIQQVELQQLKQTERAWLDHVEHLQTESASWREAYLREQQSVKDLRSIVSERDRQAIVLADRIVDLQTCIQRMTRWHQTTVRTQLRNVMLSFTTATEQLSVFSTTLHDHEEDLQTLLVDMGGSEEIDTVPTPSDSDVTQPPGMSNEDPTEDEDDEDAVFRAAQTAAQHVILR
jgi:hypothetical protein